MITLLFDYTKKQSSVFKRISEISYILNIRETESKNNYNSTNGD